MNTFIIPRGISGSGKSTISQEIQKAIPETRIFSTDTYFHDTDGNYCFDHTKLHYFHKKNFENTCNAIRKQVELIIVDNTNLSVTDYVSYAKEAKKHQYQIIGISFVPWDISAHRSQNIHNIPEKSLHNMHSKFHNEIEKSIFQTVSDEFYELHPENFCNNIRTIVAQILRSHLARKES